MRHYLKILSLDTLALLALSRPVFAASTDTGGGGGSGPSTIFNVKNPFGFTNLTSIINVLISLVFFVAGLALFLNLVLGGIQWINAGGDEKAMSSARNRITNAIIGLIIVVAAFAITKIVGAVFGISIVGGFNFKVP